MTTPVLPRHGRHRRQEQRQPDQAGLTFPAGLPLPAAGPLPGGEPVAVCRRLAYHPEQGAKSAELRDRHPRELADRPQSLRQLAEMTSLSNAYLSQLERGLHLPSVRVLKLLSEALNVSAETLLAQAGLLDMAPSGDGAAAADGPPASPVESAISAEERLADEQKAALIAVYRSMLRS